MLIAAISAETGQRRVFDKAAGIGLVDAVIASTASFGWPPILFQNEHYFDGGYYSSDNADLALGVERVMILALKRPPGVPFPALFPLEGAVNVLRKAGSVVEVIQPDERTAAEFEAAGGVMSPTISEAAVRAGRLQGRRVVDQRILEFWK